MEIILALILDFSAVYGLRVVLSEKVVKYVDNGMSQGII